MQLLPKEGTPVLKTIDGALTVWDLDGKELIHLEEKGGGFGSPSFDPDVNRIAAVRYREDEKLPWFDPGRYEARVWDVSTGRVVTTIPHCKYAVLDPQGRRLAGFAQSPDRSWRACVWDAETGAEVARLQLPDPELVPVATSLAFSPDGQRVAASIGFRSPSGTFDSTRSGLAVWDVASGRLKKVGQDRLGAIAFSPDGTRIAGVYDSMTAEVGLWDAATGRQMLALKGHGVNTSSRSSGIAFSPDGRRILSAVGRSRIATGSSAELEVRLWDATPLQESGRRRAGDSDSSRK